MAQNNRVLKLIYYNMEIAREPVLTGVLYVTNGREFLSVNFPPSELDLTPYVNVLIDTAKSKGWEILEIIARPKGGYVECSYLDAEI